MKKTINKALSLIMSIMVLLSCGMISVTVEAKSYTIQTPHYSTAVSSYQEIVDRLNYLKGIYKCQDNAGANAYWTLSGSPASSIDDSKYYYGWQCNGFAKYIFNDLFCTGSIGSYDSNMYYYPNASGATLIDKSWNFSSSDTNTVKSILSRSSIGDFVQVRRRGKDYGHSMIISGKDDNGIWIFDCNSDGKCGVKNYYQNWATFASKNVGMSLYHSTRYPSNNIKPQKSVVSVSKNLLSLNENVTFYFSSDTGIKYAIGIDDENGNRVETKEFTQSSYTRSFNKAGKYSCYISTYNNYGALDSSRIYFTVYDGKPKKSVVSTNKSSYGLNENATFYFSSDTGTKYAIGIDDENGNRVETKEFTQSSYTRSFSKAGKYSCYISTYNNYGALDSSRIYFTVEDKKPKKSVVSISKNFLSLNENATFYFSSDTGTKYAIGIDDENGNRVETKEFTQSSYTRSFSKAGKYSCYISTYNNYGALDSSRIYFTVYDKKPQKSVVSVSKNIYSLNENITFNFSSDTGTKYAIGIDDENGNRVETKEFTQSSYTRSFNKEGKYSCYISTYNNYGALDSSRIYFTVTDKHIITYNMNGGSGSISNQTKTYGQDLTLSSTKPTRTGYDFVGWNTSASATTAQYQPGGKYTANSGATLYAIWKAKQITVTFYRNQNSSDNTTATQTFTYGVSGQSFSNKNWTKGGYTLLGWSFDRNATTATYSVLSGVSNDWIKDNSPSKNLYAIWKRIDENLGTYKYANPNKTTLYARISYNGTNRYITNISDDSSNDKSYKNIQLKNENGSWQQVWEFEKLSDGGYKIISVYDGRVLDIYQTKTDNGTNIGACGTYYANGGQIWYLVKKDGKYIIQPQVSTGVYLGVANTNDGGNVQVTTSAHLFNVEILKPVGTSTMKVVQEGTSASPTKLSWTAATDATWYNLYVYDGEVWKSNCVYRQQNIRGLEWSFQLPPGTYQAHLSPVNIHNWTNSNFVSFTVKENKYTMNYNANGGTGTMNTQTLIFGENFTVPENKFVKTGYDFCYFNVYRNSDGKWFTSDGHGWQTESEINRLGYSKRNYPVGEKHTMDKNWTSDAESDLSFTFYPVWKAKQVKVTFYRNQNSSDNTTATQTFTYGVSGQAFTDKNWSKDGYTLLGWSFDRNATTNSYSITNGVINEWITDHEPNANLYAVWKPYTYTVSYNMNGGSGSIDNQTKIYGQDLTLSSTKPTRTGYDFVGWNTDASSTIAQYQPGDKYTAESDGTLYAIWKCNFNNTTSISCNKAQIGKEICITSSAIGGTAPYKYAYYYKQASASSWTVFDKVGSSAYSTNATAKFMPSNAGTYNLRVNIKDSKGNVVYKDFTVIVTEALKNNSTISATSMVTDTGVTITGSASGGTAPYKYAYYYKKTSSSSWTVLDKVGNSAYSTNTTAKFKPSDAGTYNLRVNIKDSTGTLAQNDFTVTVTEGLKNNSTVSATTVTAGTEITTTGKASGGTSPYKFAYYYKKSTESTWTKAYVTASGSAYTKNTSVTFKPTTAGTYNVKINAKDNNGTGTMVSKEFTVKVTANSAALKNNSTVSATTVTAGTEITMTGKASGGTSPYKYAYYYKKSTENTWTKAYVTSSGSAYTKYDSKTFTPKTAGTYNVRINVKDNNGTGKVVSKDFKVTVK